MLSSGKKQVSLLGQDQEYSLERPMAPEESGHGGSFERVELKGRNVGAAMSGRGGGESHYCINIHINNNVQGANNSVVMEGEVQMRDPGVHLHFDGVSLGTRAGFGPTPSKRRRRVVKKGAREERDAGGVNSGLLAVCVVSVILLLLFLSSV